MFFFFKHKTSYEMRISVWSSDVCSSVLRWVAVSGRPGAAFPSAGHPVLTRARAIHGALVATPGRPDTAHLGVTIGASGCDAKSQSGGTEEHRGGNEYVSTWRCRLGVHHVYKNHIQIDDLSKER